MEAASDSHPTQRRATANPPRNFARPVWPKTWYHKPDDRKSGGQDKATERLDNDTPLNRATTRRNNHISSFAKKFKGEECCHEAESKNKLNWLAMSNNVSTRNRLIYFGRWQHRTHNACIYSGIHGMKFSEALL